MRITNPIFLLLLIPLFVGLWYSFKSVQGMARKRKRSAFFLRGLLGTLLILALTGPESYRANHGTCTVFLVDRSDSIRDTDRIRQEKLIEDAMNQMSGDDVAGVVVFGGTSSIESAPAGKRTVRRIESLVDASASDLAGAIRLGSAIFPDGKAKRMVILSDGNETAGDARSASSAAMLDNISIDYVALGSSADTKEALVASLETPDSGREGQPFDLRVNIDSTGIRQARIRLDRDGQIVKEMPVSLQEGRNTILIPETIKSVGLTRYRVILDAPGDTDIRNNVGAGFINVKGRPKVLLVQQTVQERALATALQNSGIAVDLVPAAGIPTRPEQFQAYDTVLLNDVNAMNVSDYVQNALVTANRDSGIGLGMIGGENSFLPGGWYGTKVTDALPVDLNIRQKKSMAAASVFILADCSGSMGAVEDGQTKIKLASRAAEETIKLLGPMDRIGVAGSSDGIMMVVPMQSAADKEGAVMGARKLAVNGGGIYIRPSITKALEVLSKEPSKTRHFVLLADGADSTDWDGVFDTALQMRVLKITTSVVAIGDGKDVPNLKRLAAIGGGRFYLANRAAQLPAIFTQDTAVMSRSAIEEGAFLPKITQMDEAISGVFDGGAPPLMAYCLTEAKPLSKVLMKTKKEDPLLLTGRNGLGNTMAFTSDARARWATQWVSWQGFSTFWAQLTRSIGRQAPRNSYEVQVKSDGGKAKVVVIGKDTLGNPLTVPETPVRIGGPDGKSQELRLTQTAPGQYESEFETSKTGSYIVSVVESDGKGGNRIQTSGVSVSYPAEYRVLRPNRPLLSEIAASTKGKEITKAEEIFRPVTLEGLSMTELWPWLVALAMFLLPIDIAVRRIVVPLKELLDLRKAKSKGKTKVEVVEPIGELKQAKQRAKVQIKSTPSVVIPKRETEIPAEPTVPHEVIPETGDSAGSALLASKRKRDNS